MTPTKKAFTLIELLVVISIVVLLIAILLPALRQARVYAQTMGCLSNLRQSAIGVHGYANDNNTYIPPAIGPTYGGGYDADHSWAALMKYYVAPKSGVYACPADSNPIVKLDSAHDGHDEIEAVYSYAYNLFFGSNFMESVGANDSGRFYGKDGFHELRRRLDNPSVPSDGAPGEFQSPTITPFMADYDLDTPDLYGVVFEDIRALHWWNVLTNLYGVSDIDHGGLDRRNLGFLDGHAATASVSDRIVPTIVGPIYDGLNYYP